MALRDADDWRHNRNVAALSVGVGRLVRAWIKDEDIPPEFEKRIAEAMGWREL